MYDLVVAGAGPAGIYAAKLCESKLKVLVIEEHEEIGMPMHCSGLVSKNLDRFVKADIKFIDHRVSGAVLHSAGGRKLKLKKHGTAAYVINRADFDRHMAKGLASELKLKTRVESVSFEKDRVLVETDKGMFEAKLLLAADGSNSAVGRALGAKPKEILNGLIGIVKKPDKSKNVEMWFNRNKTDGFFWKIPRGTSTEYGMMGSGAKFIQLENFFGLDDYEKMSHPIPLGPPKTFFSRCLLVGDAAAQVKPWSGGGVIYGLTCAEIAAKTILNAFRKNDFSEEFLRSYEDEWRKKIGKNIAMGMLFREFYKKMSNEQIERIFQMLKKRKTDFSFLDMDFPAEYLTKF